MTLNTLLRKQKRCYTMIQSLTFTVCRNQCYRSIHVVQKYCEIISRIDKDQVGYYVIGPDVELYRDRDHKNITFINTS